jgi:hypothetical protein
VIAEEIAYYLSAHYNEYGVPLDDRLLLVLVLLIN